MSLKVYVVTDENTQDEVYPICTGIIMLYGNAWDTSCWINGYCSASKRMFMECPMDGFKFENLPILERRVLRPKKRKEG